MPEHCAAYCCANRRTIANRGRGITFHKFPKDKDMRKKWEVALSREGFTARESSVICSEHFKQDEFDRTDCPTQRWCYSLHLQLPGSPPKNLQIDFKAKQGHEYSKDHREFALTLLLHGPKGYKYLRERLQIFPSLIHIHYKGGCVRWMASLA
ncbi:hypothetical protein JOQ06_018237 [Pogonophryne albipinna]|uniref:THAP-type domain-containing protein n=1 Tax=Pogonophryne albipinna TaxID=1090488 RepID=A0AAD6AIW6_9TELE|nr:hypothetical protein JOQ06_018237 [Pogonophryne albipinna]